MLFPFPRYFSFWLNILVLLHLITSSDLYFFLFFTMNISQTLSPFLFFVPFDLRKYIQLSALSLGVRLFQATQMKLTVTSCTISVTALIGFPPMVVKENVGSTGVVAALLYVETWRLVSTWISSIVRKKRIVQVFPCWSGEMNQSKLKFPLLLTA